MSERLLLVQLVWIQPGRGAELTSFEDEVTPIMARYGGRMIRLPGATTDLVGDAEDPPDEVHVVTFPDRASLARYLADPARAALLPRKAGAVRATMTLSGEGDEVSTLFA